MVIIVPAYCRALLGNIPTSTQEGITISNMVITKVTLSNVRILYFYPLKVSVFFKIFPTVSCNKAPYIYKEDRLIPS